MNANCAPTSPPPRSNGPRGARRPKTVRRWKSADERCRPEQLASEKPGSPSRGRRPDRAAALELKMRTARQPRTSKTPGELTRGTPSAAPRRRVSAELRTHMKRGRANAERAGANGRPSRHNRRVDRVSRSAGRGHRLRLDSSRETFAAVARHLHKPRGFKNAGYSRQRAFRRGLLPRAYADVAASRGLTPLSFCAAGALEGRSRTHCSTVPII